MKTNILWLLLLLTLPTALLAAQQPVERQLLTIKIIGFSVHNKRSGTASWDDTRGPWWNPIGRGFGEMFQKIFNTRKYLHGTYVKGGYKNFYAKRRDKAILDRKVEAPDPYVVVEYGKTKGCSTTAFSTLDPTLNYVFPFFYRSGQEMRIRLYDYDFNDGAEVMGWLTLKKSQDFTIGEHWTGQFGRVLGLKYKIEAADKADFCDNNLVYLEESFAKAYAKRKELAEKYPDQQPKKKKGYGPAHTKKKSLWDSDPITLDYRTMEFFYEKNAINHIPCCPHGGTYSKKGEIISCSHQPTRRAKVIQREAEIKAKGEAADNKQQ